VAAGYAHILILSIAPTVHYQDHSSLHSDRIKWASQNVHLSTVRWDPQAERWLFTFSGWGAAAQWIANWSESVDVNLSGVPLTARRHGMETSLRSQEATARKQEEFRDAKIERLRPALEQRWETQEMLQKDADPQHLYHGLSRPLSAGALYPSRASRAVVGFSMVSTDRLNIVGKEGSLFTHLNERLSRWAEDLQLYGQAIMANDCTPRTHSRFIGVIVFFASTHPIPEDFLKRLLDSGRSLLSLCSLFSLFSLFSLSALSLLSLCSLCSLFSLLPQHTCTHCRAGGTAVRGWQ